MILGGGLAAMLRMLMEINFEGLNEPSIYNALTKSKTRV